MVEIVNEFRGECSGTKKTARGVCFDQVPRAARCPGSRGGDDQNLMTRSGSEKEVKVAVASFR